MWRLVPTLVREMGQAYPELVRAEALIAETLRLEESRFRKTLERGPAHPRRGDARSLSEGDSAQGRDRVHALRHLRLSARPDPGRPQARAASASIPTASTLPWSVSARRRAPLGGVGRGGDRGGVVYVAREGRRDRVPRLRDRDMPRAWWPRWCATARKSPRSRPARAVRSSSTRRRSTPSRAARSATPAPCAPTACACASPTRRRRPPICSSIPAWSSGRARSRAACRRSTSTVGAAPPSAHNHSATHLLHEALRQVLGEHVAQKGSLVAPDRLRFDFSHPKPMTADEIEQVEDIANDAVLAEFARHHAADGRRRRDRVGRRARCSARNTATKSASSPWAAGGGNAMGPYSVELCGGTHVGRTGDIGLITSGGRKRGRRRACGGSRR